MNNSAQEDKPTRRWSPHAQQQLRTSLFLVWSKCSPHTPKELLGPKDEEDEQESDAEDDSHQVGKYPELRVTERVPQRVVAGDGNRQRRAGWGHGQGRLSLAPRLGA